MPHFTNVELMDMIAYDRVGGNAAQAQILYREQFPNRVVSTSKTFTYMVHGERHRKVPS
jgi:hypothetical protein